MYRMILVAGLALGLAGCGGEDDQAASEMMEDETMASSDEHMTDDTMDEAADMMDEMSFDDMQAAFLDDYAQGDGTVATGSGLLYRVMRPGDGASPGPRDVVEVHYEGRLANGTVFDSSYERDETIEFPLDRVIAGWTEGLQHMAVGSKYQFVIPPELGYGSGGAGETIPPGAVLVFDVELFNVTPAG